MFETSQVQARAMAGQGRVTLLSMSIVIHTAVVIASIAASIASVEFPGDAPDQFESVRFARAVPLPPPAKGNPAAQRRSEPAAASPHRAAQVPVSDVAPDKVPDTATPLDPAGGQSTDATGPATTGEQFGSPDGVDGGEGAHDGGGVVDGAPEQAYVVGGDVKAPRVLRRVEPEYPQIAVQARKSGLVVVTCTIDRHGQVRDVQVLHSTFPPFEQAAMDAVRQWTFAPGSLNGRAVDTIFNLTVTFTLR